MKKLLTILMIVFSLNTFSQVLNVIPNLDKIVNVTGPTGSDATGLASAVNKVNGNVYVCGYVSGTTKDLFVAKFDSSAVQQWIYTYDNGFEDKAKEITVDGSDNVYVTGLSEQATNNSDIVTIMLNSSGAMQFVSRFNGTSNSNDQGYSIAFDGTNIWVCGYATNTAKGKDFQILKYNTSGTLLSSPKRNGTANSDDIANKLCLSGTNLFVTGVVKNTSTNGDFFTMCINTTSTSVTWTTQVNGSASGDDVGMDVDVIGSNVIVCGSLSNTSTGDDYYIAVLSAASGTTSYSNSYDGYSSTDVATALVPDKFSNFGVTGTCLNGSNYEYHTQLYTTSALVWTHKQPINCNYNTLSPKISTDTIAKEHFYVCGTYSNSTLDGMIYQIDDQGNRTWVEYEDGTNSARDVHTDVVVDGVGRVYLSSINESGTTNVYYVKLLRYSQTPVYMPCNYNIIADTFSMTHLYYPNSGEVIDSSRSFASEVLYYTKFSAPAEFIQKNKVTFCSYKCDTARVAPKDTVTRVDMVFQGANEHSKIFPFYFQDKAKLNYFMDFTDSIGITNVKGAAQLIVPNIYPLIDLHYSSNAVGSKYYFVLKPGADPSLINLFFDGVTSSTITGNDLVINSHLGSFTFKKPDIYNVSVTFSTMAIATTTVTGTNGWTSIGSDTYSINPGTYSTSWPLVIEFDMGKVATAGSVTPIGNMDWSTYLGGASSEEVKDMKADANNNVYAVGKSYSTFFPNAGPGMYQIFNQGNYDGFMAKFNNTTSPGVPIWATFVGGEQTDYLASMDIESTGYLYGVGGTGSQLLPLKYKTGAVNQAWQGPHDTTVFFQWMLDGMIFQLAPSGDTCKWLTHLGYNNHNDAFSKCKFDASDNLFMVGYTCSTNAYAFGPAPTSYTRTYNNGAYTYSDAVTDGYIVKLNTSSSPVWMTTIGASAYATGSVYPPEDNLYDLAFDSGGDLYVVGFSAGTNYTVTGGGSGMTGNAHDAVITRFDNSGIMKWSTYLGGSGYDIAYAITTNTSVSSDIYVTGVAQSGFPTSQNAGYYHTSSHAGGADDVFFVTYNSSNTRTHSSFIGGNGLDEGRDIEVDSYGVVYISGKTTSTNFYTPSANNGYSATPTGVGLSDLFICSLFKGYNDLIWAGIIGSDKNEASGYGFDVEMTIDNAQGMLYLGSQTLKQATTKYPILGSTPTFTQASNGLSDGCISRFDLTTVHNAVGIDELKKVASDILVYPNPSNDKVNLKITNFNERYNYTVYNSLGQLVLSGRLNNYNNAIDIRELKTGMYFIELNDGKTRLSAKFIKNE